MAHDSVPHASVPTFRWGRVIVGGLLIEAVLLVLAVPLIGLLDNPFVESGADGAGDFTAFFVLVAVMCAVAGVIGGRWVARPLAGSRALHGALAGVAATTIYLAICSIPPNTVAAVVAAYGPIWFVFINGLRIAGSAFGALSGRQTA